MKFVDLHTCIQGEGQLMGVPHFLIRFSGCNLRCVFRDSICDTPYASHDPEKPEITEDDLEKIITDNPQITHCLITGGEPTIQVELPKLIGYLKARGIRITMETNGAKKVDLPIDLYSISPKLGNSIPKPEQEAIRKIHLRNSTDEHIDWYRDNKYCQFKFVVSDGDTLEMIERFVEKHQLPKNVVWLMPEGIEAEHLANRRKFVVEQCIAKGYNYTDRLHIVIYGNQRIS